MNQNLFFDFQVPVALALLALVLILLAVGRVVIAMRKPAQVHMPVRMPGREAQAPYKLETPILSGSGQLDVVPQAGRESANR